MKVKRKIRSLLVSLLCAMLLAGVLPTAALAEDQIPTDNPRYTTGVSRSKTATPLDTATWTSDVTLSLPSAEEKLDSDVVFVLDGSSSADSGVVDASLSLLRDLKNAAENSGAAVNVCVVKFKRQAYKSDWFDLSTNYDAIKAAMGTKYSGGTNIHAGLLAGKAALAEHQNISPDKKYLVLVSDGSTYLYSKDGNWASDTPFSRSYYTKENYNGFAGGFWDNGLYEPNNHEGNVPRPKTTSNVATWQAYLADVAERNAESNGDQYDYHINYDLNFNHGIPSDDFKSQPCEPRTANNRDMAFYYADQVWQQIKSAGYNAYSIATQDSSAGAGNADDSYFFMNYLNDDRSLNFRDIQNEILYAVDAGSYVTDYMGYVENDYNFDFVNDPAKIYVTVGDETLEAVPLQENVYGFGWDKENNSYNYVLTYTPAADGEEHFLWNINVPITNLRHVQLHYTVKLMNPKTEAGTYGTYDANGSQGYDGLYTNSSATLYPMATGTEIVGDGQDFLKPTVSYQISYYYTVTVNFVDEDGNTVAPAYTSDSLKEGSAYDVTAQAAPAIQGYTYKVTTGDPLTGTLDGNKVITVVYTKDTVDPIKPDPVKPEPTKPADTPSTGDSSHMFLWLGLAVISGGAVIGVVIANKKKNHNR
ncbi:MAG: VWA domain-containing protein [Clostridiales bacterium]|nr:VWA domain-containing protein [Clostridiales bacterium]